MSAATISYFLSMAKRIFYSFLLTLIGGGFLFALASGAAAGPFGEAQERLRKAVGNTGLSPQIETPVGAVVKGALSLVGTVFLLLTVYAGILWMTAEGQEERVEKARKIITASVIGLFITLGAYAITFFVTTRLGGAAPGGGGTTPAGVPPVSGTPGFSVTTEATCWSQGGWCMDDALTGDKTGGKDYAVNDYDSSNPCDPNGTDPFENHQLGTCENGVKCCELKASTQKCTQLNNTSCGAASCGPTQYPVGFKCDNGNPCCGANP